MNIDRMKKLSENQQSETMNDDAIALVKKNYPDFTVKMTSV